MENEKNPTNLSEGRKVEWDGRKMEKRKRWREQRLNTQNQDHGFEIVEDDVDLENVKVLIKDTWPVEYCTWRTR